MFRPARIGTDNTSTGGIFSQLGGIVGKEQPRHEKAIPMGLNSINVPCSIVIL